jgi:transposase
MELQKIIEYKARLSGLMVVYLNAKNTSGLCPTCGEKISPNGYRRMRCPTCRLEEDRDIIAVKNPLQRYQTDVGGFNRSPRKPSHVRRREGMKANARPERWFLRCWC